MPDVPPELDYAPPPPWHQRKRTRRWAIVASIVLVSLSAIGWLPPLYRHVLMLYWQHQCMTFSRPANHVVYKKGAANTGGIPQPWANLYPALSGSVSTSAGTIFLHERGAGIDVRLISVEWFVSPNGDGSLRVVSIVPGNGSKSPKENKSLSLWKKFDNLSDKQPQTIFAGQIDPNDDSHFTIEFIFHDDQRAIIDGWLKPSDLVLLEDRPTPSPPSSPAPSPK